MQLDVKDLSVADLQKIILKYGRLETLNSRWKDLIGWDGNLIPTDRRAIFYKYIRWSLKKVSKELAGDLKIKRAPTYDQFLNFLIKNDSIDVNGRTLTTKKYFDKVVFSTDSLFEKYGHRKEDRPFAFNVPQITSLPGLTVKIDDIGGSDNTINVNYDAHPVIRTLIEIQNGSIHSWMVNAISQTGRVNQKKYFQQLNSWKKNEMHQTQFYSDSSRLKNVIHVISITNK